MRRSRRRRPSAFRGPHGARDPEGAPVDDGVVVRAATSREDVRRLDVYMRGENANEGGTRIIAGNHDSAVHREWYEENWQELSLHRSSDAPEVRFNL